MVCPEVQTYKTIYIDLLPSFRFGLNAIWRLAKMREGKEDLDDLGMLK